MRVRPEGLRIMPIYEYRCADCEQGFEVLVRSGRDEAECPACHGAHLVREMSVFASGVASHTPNGEAPAAATKAPFGGRCWRGGGRRLRIARPPGVSIRAFSGTPRSDRRPASGCRARSRTTS